MKRLIALVLTAGLVLPLAMGCGDDKGTTTAKDKKPSGVNTTGPAKDAPAPGKDAAGKDTPAKDAKKDGK